MHYNNQHPQNSANSHPFTAEPCHASVYYRLGVACAHGHHVSQNDTAANDLFSRAAALGSVPAQLWLEWRFCGGELAWKYLAQLLDGSTPEQSFDWLFEVAQEGHAEAANNVGGFYADGRGVEADYSAAVAWCRQAAATGLPEAQHNLGVCYATGRGVGRDSKAAVDWFRMAAGQGFGEAQFRLAQCYAHGKGMAQDTAGAIQWYRKAAAQGHSASGYALDWWFCKMEGEFRNQGRRVEGLRVAIENRDDAKAKNNLAGCYALGHGVSPDYALAVKWCRAAASQGLPEAQSNLGLCFAHGHGVAQDWEQAFRWFRRAAEQGLAEAQCNLGSCYDSASGVARNCAEAAQWYRRAADQGHATGTSNLASCYEHGEGVPQLKAVALYWYRKAARHGHPEARRKIERIQKELTLQHLASRSIPPGSSTR